MPGVGWSVLSTILSAIEEGAWTQTAAELSRRGASVVGIDRNSTDDVELFFKADLGDPESIDVLVEELPGGANGLCNIAGVPPTAPSETVLKVNAMGLRRFRERMVPKLADGALTEPR